MATLSSLIPPGSVISETGTATLTNKTIGDDLKFADADESNYVALQAATTVASNVTWTLPNADGTNGQLLSTNGTGTLSWATGGGGSSITAGDSSVAVTDAGTGKVEVTVDNVEVADFTTGAIVFNETGANQDFRVEGDSNANLIVADAGVDKVGIGTNTFNTNGGVLQVSNGISFPATQSASTDANTLDDYEEGTWTPSVGGSTTAGTTTYTRQTGSYTKIGRQVTLIIDIAWSAATGTGNFQITNLPFAPVGSSPAGNGVGSVMTANLNWTAGSYLTIYSVPAGPALLLYGSTDDGALTQQTITNEAAQIWASVIYFTS